MPDTACREGPRAARALDSHAARALDPCARELPIWPLPLLAGGLPAVAALFALGQYAAEQGAFCNPFVDDCVSISRMARHGLANPLFRLLVLPGAVLQALTWWLQARVFAEQGLARHEARWLLAIGLGAAATLVVYGSFLGTEGEVYRWLRRHGPLLYFGGTYAAMLLFMRALRRLGAAHRLALPRVLARTTLALLGFVAVVALCHGFASLGRDAALENRIENLSEWWGSLALTLVFAIMAVLWRRWALVASLRVGGTAAR